MDLRLRNAFPARLLLGFAVAAGASCGDPGPGPASPAGPDAGPTAGENLQGSQKLTYLLDRLEFSGVDAPLALPT